jgi:hypothetical protein
MEFRPPRQGRIRGAGSALDTRGHDGEITLRNRIPIPRNAAKEEPMKRREMLGALGVGAAGLTALSAGSSPAQQPRGEEHPHHHDKVHEDCLKACSDCARSCDETFHHCYMMVAQGKKEHAKSLHLVSDCAGFCSLSACMIAKHSPLMVHSCASCAEACKATAEEVGKFDSAEMKRAAESLRKCEQSCREMVRAMGGHHHA